MPGLIRHNRFLQVGTLILVCLHVHPIGGGILDEAPQTPSLWELPADTRTEWVLGISSLKDKGLSQENLYLVHSIPQLLNEELKLLDTHILNDREKDAYRSKIIAEKILSLESMLIRLSDERDRVMFESSISVEERLSSLDSRMEEILRSIDQVRTSNAISVLEEKQIVLKEFESSPLLPPHLFSPREYALENEVDLLIWGEIEELQQVLLLRIHLFHALMDEEVFLYEDAGSPENLYSSIPQIVRECAELILGREWVSLSVLPEPLDSRVTMDGVFKGIGRVNERYILPGDLSIRVDSPGYASWEKEVHIDPYEEREIVVTLEKKELVSVLLRSTPSDSSVYLNSQWVGTTPLLVDIASPNQRLVLMSEGYEDMPYWVPPDPPFSIELTLQKKLLDRNTWQEKKRNIFYTALGAWAVSLPFPFYLNSFAWDSAYALERSVPGSDEWNRYALRTELLYYGYLGSIFISAVLFVNAVDRLLTYVDYAHRPVE